MKIPERTIVIHFDYMTAACAALCILAVCSSYVSAAYAAIYALAIMPSASPAAVGGAYLQEQTKYTLPAHWMYVVHIFYVNSLYMCVT